MQRFPRREWPGGLGACGELGAGAPLPGSIRDARVDVDGGRALLSCLWDGPHDVRISAYLDTLPAADGAPGELLELPAVAEGTHDVDLFPWLPPGPPRLVPDLHGGRAYLRWTPVSGATSYRVLWADGTTEPTQFLMAVDGQRFGPVTRLPAEDGSGFLDTDGPWTSGASTEAVTADGTHWEALGQSGLINGTWAALANGVRLKLSSGASGAWEVPVGPPSWCVTPALAASTYQFAVTALIGNTAGPAVSGSVISAPAPDAPAVTDITHVGSGFSVDFTGGPAAMYSRRTPDDYIDELWPMASGASPLFLANSGAPFDTVDFYLRASGEWNFQMHSATVPLTSNAAALSIVDASGAPHFVAVTVEVDLREDAADYGALWLYVGDSGTSGSGVPIARVNGMGFPTDRQEILLGGSYDGVIHVGVAGSSGSGILPAVWPVATHPITIPVAPPAVGSLGLWPT